MLVKKWNSDGETIEEENENDPLNVLILVVVVVGVIAFGIHRLFAYTFCWN